MEHISKTKLKAHALEVFRNIEQTGKSVIVTDHGQPTLEIRKIRQHSVDPLEILRGTVVKFEDPTSPVADDDWENA